MARRRSPNSSAPCPPAGVRRSDFEHAPPIRLLATDLDGTLLDRRYAISAANYQAIRDLRAAGIHVVPATGRQYRVGAGYAFALGLDGLMIFQNGAVTKELLSRQPLHFQPLPPALVPAIAATGRAAGCSPVCFGDPFGTGRLYLEERPVGQERMLRFLELSRTAVTVVRDSDRLARLDVLQAMFSGSVADMRCLAARFRDRFGDDIRVLLTEYPDRDLTLLDVMHPDVSKGTALRRVARTLGVPMEQVAAAGDNFNDREMLATAALPLVMGNADPDLRAAFPAAVLPDCEADGLAWGIWRHVLHRPDRIARWFPERPEPVV